MNAIQTADAGATIASDLQPALITEFIAYIDRGEKTTRTYLTNLRQFFAFLKYKGITRPDRQSVIEYREYLAAEHDAIQLDPAAPCGWTYRTDSKGNPQKVTCRANTIKQYLQSVRQFFNWTAAAGYYPNISANIHAPKVRQDAHKKEALTAADVRRIEESIKQTAATKAAAAACNAKDTAGRTERATEQGRRLYAMYLLAVTAGLRTIELSRANIKDVEYKNGAAYLYIWGKGHAEADAKKPLAPAVYKAILEYIDSRSDNPTGSSPLFVATGNRSGGQRLAPTSISTMLKKAMQDAGYNSDRLTAHSLRHTAGSNVMEMTGDLFLTQQYMRHENPKTTEIYLHINTERQEAAIATQLYNRYHDDGQHAARETLAALLQTMTAAQITQLAGLAQAIAR